MSAYLIWLFIKWKKTHIKRYDVWPGSQSNAQKLGKYFLCHISHKQYKRGDQAMWTHMGNKAEQNLNDDEGSKIGDGRLSK